MAGRKFEKRNPGTGKFAKGGVVIRGRKKKSGLSKKARRVKNQTKHYAARYPDRAAKKLNRPKVAKAIIGAASGAVAAYIAFETLRDTPLGKQVETDVRSRMGYRKVAPAGSKANGTPYKSQRKVGSIDNAWSEIQTTPLGSGVPVKGEEKPRRAPRKPRQAQLRALGLGMY